MLKDLEQPTCSLSSEDQDNRSREEELERWTRRVAVFEREFGFRMKRTRANNHLQVLFQGCGSLSKDNGNDVEFSPPCYCIFEQMAENQLRLIKCNPLIPDIDRLVEFVNQNRDIRSFLIILRRRFCRYFELRKAIAAKSTRQ